MSINLRPETRIRSASAADAKKRLDEAMEAGVNDFMSKKSDASLLGRHIEILLTYPVVFVREGRSLRPERQETGTPATTVGKYRVSLIRN